MAKPRRAVVFRAAQKVNKLQKRVPQATVIEN
jgi:hypothetical protein